MSIQGVQVDVRFDPPAPFTDEWVDAVYISLEKNMAIVSVDMFVNEEDGTIRFILGIDNFLDTDGFSATIAQEAIESAFDDAAGPNQRTPQSSMDSSRVAVFA